ncbi:MAG: ParB/RepB/Spo0J family partition protein [Chloracidobacterium sp.]|nr:ParB/RepB/Spo0J family partition protein [Chloracidobacterium sp.]
MRHDRHYVEELSSRGATSVGRMIALDRLEPNPQQPRVDLGDLEELVASIRERGVLEPLLVRPSQVGGRFMIISGERRFRAACEAGLREVPCIELNVDDRAVAEIALIENLQRKDLTPYEESEGLLALKERFGYTHEDIAKRIGKSRSSVTESLIIAGLPDEIKSLCQKAGVNSKSMLLQVAKQSDPVSMHDFINRVSKQGMNRDEARKAGKKSQTRPQPYIFRHQSLSKDYTVEVKFRKSSVSKDELLQVIQKLLDELMGSE